MISGRGIGDGGNSEEDRGGFRIIRSLTISASSRTLSSRWGSLKGSFPSPALMSPTEKIQIFDKMSMGKTPRDCIDIGTFFLFQKYCF